MAIPFDEFVRDVDGSWRPRRPMVIELPGAGKISVGPWLKFQRGRGLLGHDVAAELDAIAQQMERLSLDRAA